MTNFFKTIGLGAAMMITGLAATDASAQMERPGPKDPQFYVGAPRVSATATLKVGPTIVPVIDSNAILNLDYKEMRSTPALAEKPASVVPAVIKEPTIAELKLQLKTAEAEYKASKLAYTQAVRSKDKTRVAAAKANRTAAHAKVTDLKKAVAAKQPAVRQAPKKRTGGTVKATAATKAK